MYMHVCMCACLCAYCVCVCVYSSSTFMRNIFFILLVLEHQEWSSYFKALKPRCSSCLCFQFQSPDQKGWLRSTECQICFFLALIFLFKFLLPLGFLPLGLLLFTLKNVSNIFYIYNSCHRVKICVNIYAFPAPPLTSFCCFTG